MCTTLSNMPLSNAQCDLSTRAKQSWFVIQPHRDGGSSEVAVSQARQEGSVAYSLRTAMASMAALYVAMWLQLDTPRWAMWTVVVVSLPTRGDILRKAAARAAGTPVGCIAAIILAALFPQDRVGYVLGLGLWIGLCGSVAARSRGYAAYGAALAGFTCAIVASDAITQPHLVFSTAVNRGTATMLGVIFALLAAALAARTDDVPGDLADHVCDVARRLLDWAHDQLDPMTMKDNGAPLTGSILDLDTDILNAFAERPALRLRAGQWVAGLPAALLSIQSVSLELSHQAGHQQQIDAAAIRPVLARLRDLLKPGARAALSRLRSEADRLVNEKSSSRAVAEATNAAAVLLAGIEATLTLRRPASGVAPFPPLSFSQDPRRTQAALLRGVVGVVLAFLLWDATAWPTGPVFVLWVAVLLVVGAAAEDSFGMMRVFAFGNVIGVVVGVAVQYLLLQWSDRFEWLAIVSITLFTIGIWAETLRPTSKIALGYCNGLLLGINPINPQSYDLQSSIQNALGLVAGMAFALVLFGLIGAQGSAKDQTRRALNRMHTELSLAKRPGFADWTQQRGREARMYDDLRRLQAARHDPADHRTGINLLLACRVAFALHNGDESENTHVSLAAT
jgi:uncharacterized membrane protein YccC